MSELKFNIRKRIVSREGALLSMKSASWKMLGKFRSSWKNPTQKCRIGSFVPVFIIKMGEGETKCFSLALHAIFANLQSENPSSYTS